MRSFLGFVSYYRLVVTTKRIKFEWGVAQEEPFLAIKRAFTLTPMLHFSKAMGRFILDTEASAFTISGVLSQIQDGVEVLLSFASNQFNKVQWNYIMTKCELTVIVVYAKKWKHNNIIGKGNFVVVY